MEAARILRTALRASAIQTARAARCARNLDPAFFALQRVRRETSARPIARARRKPLRPVIKLPFVSRRTMRVGRPMKTMAEAPRRALRRVAVGAAAIRTSVARWLVLPRLRRAHRAAHRIPIAKRTDALAVGGAIPVTTNVTRNRVDARRALRTQAPPEPLTAATTRDRRPSPET